MAQWQTNGENYWLNIDEHNFVSYNPSPSIMGDGPETALVIEDSTRPHNRRFLILAGDFRTEYEQAIERDGLGGCLRVFEMNRDKENIWSNGLPNED